MRFNEVELADGALAWLIRKDSCLHCDEPGCLLACPAPGAIIQYENGIVDFNQDACIGCQYCVAGCPFDIPRFDTVTKKVYKCTLCIDRVSTGLEPACVKACPTGAIRYGTKEDMLAYGHDKVEKLKARGFNEAVLYDPVGVGGLHMMYVVPRGEMLEQYGLPGRPHGHLAGQLSTDDGNAAQGRDHCQLGRSPGCHRVLPEDRPSLSAPRNRRCGRGVRKRPRGRKPPGCLRS